MRFGFNVIMTMHNRDRLYYSSCRFKRYIFEFALKIHETINCSLKNRKQNPYVCKSNWLLIIIY